MNTSVIEAEALKIIQRLRSDDAAAISRIPEGVRLTTRKGVQYDITETLDEVHTEITYLPNYEGPPPVVPAVWVDEY